MSASSRTARARTRDPELELRRVQAEAYLDLSRIHREIEARAAALLEEHDLRDVTPAQAGALMILFQEKQPLRARELAQRLGLSEVTVGRFVHALHATGWVRREPDPDDSRAILIAPTTKAYRALPRFIAVSNALLDQAFAGFSPEDIVRVAKTTERLRKNITARAQNQG
jgi:DNA-binding MarR family transcriptional regulator